MSVVQRIWDKLSHVFLPRFSNNQRPRILHPAGLSILVGIFLLNYSVRTLISYIPNLVLGYASSVSVEEVISLTNSERAKASLPKLSQNPQLTQAALAKASDMFLKDYWAHVSPSGIQPWKFIKDAGYVYHHAGENLARDFSNTPDVISAWMTSPSHRDNVLNSNYSDIGVAVVDGSLGGVETRLVVQMFGAPAAVPVAAKVPEPLQIQTVPQAETAPIVEEAPLEPVEVVQVPQTEELVLEPQVQEEVILSQPAEQQAEKDQASQLAGTSILQAPVTEGRRIQKLISPNQITQAFGLILAMLIMGTLLVDWIIAHRKKTIRLVGRNWAHLMFIGAISLLLIQYSQGKIL